MALSEIVFSFRTKVILRDDDAEELKDRIEDVNNSLYDSYKDFIAEEINPLEEPEVIGDFYSIDPIAFSKIPKSLDES
jgi:hypothetical protein